jgi:APA family basic amino acid/polyamine antiporter
MTTPADTPREDRLGVWDGVSVIIGIVVGVSLYKAPAPIFGAAGGALAGMALWVAGGALSLVGALVYAELASTYPRSGGDYVYLSRAYAPWVGFLFGWAQLAAIVTGSIGAMAYVFADYAVALAGGGRPAPWAALAIVGLTALNLFGVAFGRRVQNALTVAKVVGLAGILGAGVFAPGGPPPPAEPVGEAAFGFAMILVLYAYGGWNDAAFVAADVREPRRNIVRVLLLGTGAVVGIYLLINAAYLAGLGFDGLRTSSAPAADVLAAALGPWGGRVMSALVMISALGAINGMVFTGSRVFASVGADHRAFAALGRWHPRLKVPVRAFLAQGGVALGLVLAVGTETGRALVDAAVGWVGPGALPWERFGGGFDTLVAGTAPVFWVFFLATGASLFVLRRRDAGIERPFRVPLYPWTPLVFCATCLFMLHASVSYAREIALLGVVPLLAGLPVYAWSRRGRPGS